MDIATNGNVQPFQLYQYRRFLWQERILWFFVGIGVGCLVAAGFILIIHSLGVMPTDLTVIQIASFNYHLVKERLTWCVVGGLITVFIVLSCFISMHLPPFNHIIASAHEYQGSDVDGRGNKSARNAPAPVINYPFDDYFTDAEGIADCRIREIFNFEHKCKLGHGLKDLINPEISTSPEQSKSISILNITLDGSFN
ncbi:unnamed protein product [Bursaphelenchus xylophilus]|uniref:(pine wood nematode) hypothetical protein n=1 Tax=Bursaphelenchus xylophilus TaxID=6326 RepID=A0A7I8WK91_BURXY|nr:unnamed protein product [Bursaphelenchus xylophilus]CAG9106995.1 unnamed protein product [Bursaphelenchus xylophilus]